MVGAKFQLKVVKSDGSVEEYLHTKVLGAIYNALAETGDGDGNVDVVERLADAVTYYLYHRQDGHTTNSSEILSVIKACLAATNHEEAAIALSEHHCQRRLKRGRVEVVSLDVQKLADAERLCSPEELNRRSAWDKSVIVHDLTTEHGIDRQVARAIASMVEEKVLNMGITLIPASLIRQLVLGDTATMMHAHRQLQIV